MTQSARSFRSEFRGLRLGAWGCGAAGVGEVLGGELAAEVAEGVDLVADLDGGGDFAGGSGLTGDGGLERGGEGWEFACEGEGGEGAMDLAAGADALYDFLA